MTTLRVSFRIFLLSVSLLGIFQPAVCNKQTCDQEEVAQRQTHHEDRDADLVSLVQVSSAKFGRSKIDRQDTDDAGDHEIASKHLEKNVNKLGSPHTRPEYANNRDPPRWSMISVATMLILVLVSVCVSAFVVAMSIWVASDETWDWNCPEDPDGSSSCPVGKRGHTRHAYQKDDIGRRNIKMTASPTLTDELGLPPDESVFLVPLKVLPNQPVHVISLQTGKEKLRVDLMDNGRKAEISLVEGETGSSGDIPKRVSVRPLVAPRGMFTIFDSHGDLYGKFQCVGRGLTEVLIDDESVMTIKADSSSMQFSVTSVEATPKRLATARVNTKDFVGDHFEVHTFQGTDAVLILTVLLAPSMLAQQDSSLQGPHSSVMIPIFGSPEGSARSRTNSPLSQPPEDSLQDTSQMTPIPRLHGLEELNSRGGGGRESLSARMLNKLALSPHDSMRSPDSLRSAMSLRSPRSLPSPMSPPSEVGEPETRLTHQ